jgi:hypothetical protein
VDMSTSWLYTIEIENETKMAFPNDFIYLVGIYHHSFFWLYTLQCILLVVLYRIWKVLDMVCVVGSKSCEPLDAKKSIPPNSVT